MLPRQSIHEVTQGRWRGILSALGLNERQLNGKHCECPICQNGPKSDSFRFDDKDGRGTWICSHCGAGSGVDLVMKMRGVDFKEACRIIEPLAGVASFKAPKAKVEDPSAASDHMMALWTRARLLTGSCLASRYLANRGIVRTTWPSSLRFIDELPYSEGGNTRLYLPAMLAKFAAPDGKSAMLHRTWLSEPGDKADVDPCRKMYPGKIPEGGAVRLGPVLESMGVAEGIETALAASQIHGIPVWAATSAGELVKFRPPAECRNLIIFGDNDPSWTGQLAVYSLARRLAAVPLERRIAVEVRLPGYWDRGDREDWNDVLIAEKAA